MSTKRFMEDIMRGSIDYNIIVDIPEDAHVCSDHRVYVVIEKRYYQQLGYNLDDRLWIGKAISETKMHPNGNFKERYRTQLKEIQHLNLPDYTLRIGLYCGCLSVSIHNGLYADLNAYFGPENANLIMDYAMYSGQLKVPQSVQRHGNYYEQFQVAPLKRSLFAPLFPTDSPYERF